jgi:hypothetical protein
VPAVLPRMYASRQCFKPGKDIVMPVFTSISQMAASPHLASAPRLPPRPTLFHFRGQILRRESRYSMGIRQQVLGMHECKTGTESASRKEMEGVRRWEGRGGVERRVGMGEKGDKGVLAKGVGKRLQCKERVEGAGMARRGDSAGAPIGECSRPSPSPLPARRTPAPP